MELNLVSCIVNIGIHDYKVKSYVPQIIEYIKMHQLLVKVESHQQVKKLHEYAFTICNLNASSEKLQNLCKQEEIELSQLYVYGMDLLNCLVQYSTSKGLFDIMDRAVSSCVQGIKYKGQDERVKQSACKVLLEIIKRRRDMDAVYSTKVSELLTSAMVQNVVHYLEQAEDARVGFELVKEWIEFSPSSVRPYANKLKNACTKWVQEKEPFAVTVLSLVLSKLGNKSDRCSSQFSVMGRCLHSMVVLLDAATNRHGMDDMPEELRDAQILAIAGIERDHLSFDEAASLFVARLEAIQLLFTETLTGTASFHTFFVSEYSIIVQGTVAITEQILQMPAFEVGRESSISKDGSAIPSVYLYGSLPKMHQTVLSIWSTLLQHVGRKLLPWTHTLSSLLIKFVQMDVSPQTKSLAYTTCTMALTVFGAGSVDIFGEPLIAALTLELCTIQNTKTEQRHLLHSTKANRKRKLGASGGTCSSSMNPYHQDTVYTTSTMSSLSAAILICGSMLAASARVHLCSLLVDPKVFSIFHNQVAYYECLHANLTIPTRQGFRVPFLSQAIHCFTQGTNSRNAQVQLTCRLALTTIETIVHPRVPILHLPSKTAPDTPNQEILPIPTAPMDDAELSWETPKDEQPHPILESPASLPLKNAAPEIEIPSTLPMHVEQEVIPETNQEVLSAPKIEPKSDDDDFSFPDIVDEQFGFYPPR